MRHKTKIGRTAALAAIQTAPKTALDTPAEPRNGMKAFAHKFDIDQEATKNAPLKAAQGEHSRLLRELIDRDIPTLYVAPSSFLEATAPSVGDGSQFNNVNPQEIRATIRRVFSEFEDSIMAEGQLTVSGRQKLQNIAQVNLSVDWTQVPSWTQAFYLLRAAGELSIEPSAQPEQDQTDHLQEVLDAPNSREGERAARVAANASYWTGEAAEMFSQWSQLLYDTWEVTLTAPQKQAVVQYFLDTNKSFLRHESFNEARRYLVKAGVLPSNMVTEDEVLAGRLEHTNLNDRDARIEFAQESRRINGR